MARSHTNSLGQLLVTCLLLKMPLLLVTLLCPQWVPGGLVWFALHPAGLLCCIHILLVYLSAFSGFGQFSDASTPKSPNA